MTCYVDSESFHLCHRMKVTLCYIKSCSLLYVYIIYMLSREGLSSKLDSYKNMDLNGCAFFLEKVTHFGVLADLE